MPNFSVNLTVMFRDLPFMKRFDVAAQLGFKAVEMAFPYDYPISDIKVALHKYHLELVLFNLPAGNWSEGERGLALYPDRKNEFKKSIRTAISYATELGVSRINCLVGKQLPKWSHNEQHQTMIENLRFAANELSQHNIKLLVEHLNSNDMPGFYLNTTNHVLSVLDEVNHPNIFLQYDIYHAQRSEGELANILRNHLSRIAHIQIADNPGRHQPGTGEINYKFLFAETDKLGYQGWVGLEYIPEGPLATSIQWITEYGY